MSLGEKIRAARLEVGLSQRQLCDGLVTRNMLSQIENGSARPSMGTLTELAHRLGKTVAYFLEEEEATPNGAAMAAARQAFDAGNFAAVAQVLEQYRQPDSAHDWERDLLWVLSHLALAEEAMKQGRIPYARQLLDQADLPVAYCREEIDRRRLLLRGKIRGERVSDRLPSLDEELLLRAREALEEHLYDRAAVLLDAAEDRTEPAWLLLRGEVWAEQKRYTEAARCFHGAEPEFPYEAAQWLEICYRELGDYRQAYNYAKKNGKEKGKG